jgi:hypothetical protein
LSLVSNTNPTDLNPKEHDMATKKNTPAALDDTLEAEAETTAEATPKQIINEAIGRVVEATGIDVQKNRYKAMRAIAYQAFSNAIEDGTFDALVDEAISNIDNLPSGWEIERVAKDEPVKAAKPAATKTAPAKKAAAKVVATPAAKPVRKRPTR